jgi:cobalt-zinc-cadmium efflux system outer membrane protein
MLLSRFAFVAGLLAAASSVLTAQGPPGSALTLQAALDRALTANPAIAAARLRNPIASIEFQKETPKQSYGFSVPLELGGKRAKRIAVGEATVRACEAEIAVVVAQVRNDVRRAYFGLLAAGTRLALMQEIREIAVRSRDAAQQRFAAGGAPRLEVMQGARTRVGRQ